MSKSAELKMAEKVAAVISLVALVLTVPLWGMAASALWSWFVVGTFSAVPVPWWQASGIGLLIGLVKTKSRDLRDVDDETPERVMKSAVKAAMMATILPVVAILVGAVLRLFA